MVTERNREVRNARLQIFDGLPKVTEALWTKREGEAIRSLIEAGCTFW